MKLLKFNEFIKKSNMLNDIQIIQSYHLVNECVIANTQVEDGVIMIKNRDRAYKVDLELRHEIIDGVEVLYLYDVLTTWAEGMNEFGIGILNSSLLVIADEQEGKDAKKGGRNKQSTDGEKIITALTHKKIEDVVQSIQTYHGKDKTKTGVKGHTLVTDKNGVSYTIEMTSKDKAFVKKQTATDKVIRTNHGINYKDKGYTKGYGLKSSKSRMKIAKEILDVETTENGLLKSFGKQHIEDTSLNPRRETSDKTNLTTSTTILMNLSDLRLVIKKYNKHINSFKYVDNTPKNHIKKLKYDII